MIDSMLVIGRAPSAGLGASYRSMDTSTYRIAVAAALALAVGACGQPPSPGGAAASPPPVKRAAVDVARLIAADAEPGNWMAPGRTYGEQRFSPLENINADNVKQLGLAWSYDLDTAHRGQESTPLV